MNSSIGRSSTLSAVRLASIGAAEGGALIRASALGSDQSVVAPSPIAAAVERSPERVRTLRRIGRSWLLNMCRMPKDRAEAVLVVISELVTNAVLHGSNPSIGLRGYFVAPGQVCFEVIDGTISPVPEIREGDLLAESGRGLPLVDGLIEELGGSWGFTEDGAMAWCRVPVIRASKLPPESRQ
ncbi:ATP-binding protein [Streptomyces sp. KL116D]|uniref:ATP-binding protein n=1 Tax=Streptomyces sp. KL116D TaxID=3045152 RepID=UPI003555F3ED